MMTTSRLVPLEPSAGPDLPDGPLVPLPGLAYGALDGLMGYALRRAQNALYLDFARATARWDISPQRFAALVLVAENPGLHQGVLAEAMGRLHRSGAMRLTNWLAKRGWVERRDDPDDARSWGLYLTPAGRRAVADITQAVREHDAALLQAMGSGAQGLKSLLEQLALQANARAGAPTRQPLNPCGDPP